MKSSHDLHRLPLSRRAFLGGATGAAAALSLGSSLQPLRRRRAEGPRRPTLVYVFLRGGLDPLTACVPHADEELYKARPRLAVPKPGQPDGATDLDGFFGLPPSATPLLTPYKDGRLAIVHAAGSTDLTRSHFKAFKHVEFGLPAQPITLGSGWIARHLETVEPPPDAGSLRAIALEPSLPYALAQGPACLPVPDPDAVRFPGRGESKERRRGVLDSMYARAADPTGAAGARSIGMIAEMTAIDFAGRRPANGAAYPDTAFGRKLRAAATLIHEDLGLECLMINLGNFDHHNKLGPLDGAVAGLLDDFSRGVEAFYLDLRERMDDVILVAHSEFGRRVAENASLGTDHGHGGVMFAMGGAVQGGRVVADWPGLAPDDLNRGDLAITTDYRDVLGEILVDQLHCGDLASVFPAHELNKRGILTPA